MDNVAAKKSLGQNFLHDRNIIEKIVTSNNIKENDLIVEIGPGKGALTQELKRYNSRILCYEIDERMRPILRNIENEKVNVIYGDFLEKDVCSDIKDLTYNNLYIIGNLPYYITTPIIERVIALNLNPQAMTFMVQKEVADRFTALPGSKQYGSLTIYLNYYFNVTKLFNVKNTCFSPIPKVESAVVKFTKKENKYDVINEKHFFKLIHDSFQFKRKNLRNNLKNYNLELILEVLKKYDYDLTVRAEQLPLEAFVDISNYLAK